MDPFGRLPWFALYNILSALPDLRTLHSLHNASPDVAAFLQGNNDLFAQIVDSIMESTARERGLTPIVQRAVRYLVTIWTAQSKRERQQQDPDQNILNSLQYLAEQYSNHPTPISTTISPSTPAAILCRLLALMTRLRCLVHASFHDMVSKALQLKIEHLPRKAAYINTRGVGPAHRPPGVPYTPVDVGPLMWIEEQCLLGSFLWIVIFYELRRIYGDFDVPPVRGETVYISSLDTAETFWKKILCGDNNTQREQIATTLQWLDIKSGGRENISSLLSSNPLPLPNTYQHRYPKSTTLSDTEWETEEKWICNAFPTYGALCLWEARVSPISPLRCVDYAVFRPYGLIFWSVRRMDGLGFREAFDVKHRMWFALSFVLDQEDWDEVVKRQAERGFDPRAV